MNENRIEKKFVFGKFKEDYLEKILLSNGFTKLYPSRYINSIYLDTLNFDFARDNINGVSKRKKIRFTIRMLFLKILIINCRAV